MEATEEDVIILCINKLCTTTKTMKTCEVKAVKYDKFQLSTKQCYFLKTMVLRSQDDSVVFPKAMKTKKRSSNLVHAFNKVLLNVFGRKINQIK